MLLTSIAALALTLPAAASAPAPAPRIESHGKLEWFAGPFDAALVKAKAENKIVFIDFWTSWCGPCKALVKNTFSDDTVAAEMKDVICLSVDAESETGVPLAAKFSVRAYPTMLLLEPDGSVRDQLVGYMPPDKFKQEIQRVKRNQDTLPDLRKRIAADTRNLKARSELAGKLKSIGDVAGAQEQLAEMKKLDPERESLDTRKLEYELLTDSIEAEWMKTKALDTSRLVAYLDKETYPGILFDGWMRVLQMDMAVAKKSKDAAARDKANAEAARAARTAWKHCPPEAKAQAGNQIAWSFWELREFASADDKAFALEVARASDAAMPNTPQVLDTLACVLFMNGQKDEAAKTIEKCMQLDPQNPQWPKRLEEFGVKS